MSDEEHHETFEATGAGASMTYPLVLLVRELWTPGGRLRWPGWIRVGWGLVLAG